MIAHRYLISGLFSFGLLPGYVWAQTPTPTPEDFARLPLAFEKQSTGLGERFVARGPGYVVGLDHGKASFGVLSKDGSSHTVSLEFTRSRPSQAVPGSELPGKVNYIRGNDPRNWRIGLPTYARVTYSDTYPGIDVVYYGNQQQLEFDLVVKPGANPEAIRLKVGGAGTLSIDESGALNLGEGGLIVPLPRIYQEMNGAKKIVPGRYAIVGRDEVAFRVDPWDRTLPLVIDPTIVYSAMFGGGLGNHTNAYAIRLDSSGNILLAGYTDATDFPTLNGYQNGQGGNGDAFVSKINSTGTALVYSTYLGGSGNDYATGLAVDSTNAVWVTGDTGSSDFPVLHPAQPAFGGVTDAFVARLDASGVLQFSTFLGGTAGDFGTAIAVDSNNNGYVAGFSYGTFPTTTSALQLGGSFVAKYGPTGVLLFSALPTPGTIQGIAVDSAFNAYVTGSTTSGPFTGMPAGGAQATNSGGGDAFVAKINPSATSLLYFTFLGGTGLDQGMGIAVDGMGDAYIAGQTNSTGIGTPGAAQQALAGGIDGFVAKLNPAGSHFSYVTYLGGIRQDYLTGLALGDAGSVYLTGYTDSNDFPSVSALQSPLPGVGTSLFQSTNTAGSFSAFDTNIPGAAAGMSINPSTGSAVVLTEVGIYRTTNGGTSWTQQFAGPFSGYSGFIARSPVASSTLYATQYYNSFYSSTDDGVTWSPASTSPGEASGILADPLTAGTVYFFCNCSPSVYVSTNGGTTWNPASTGLPVAQVGAMTSTPNGAIYAGVTGFGIYKSTNQGGSWTAVNTGLPPSPAVNPYTLTSSGSTPYFVALGNVYITSDGGAHWEAAPTSVGASYIAVSPQAPPVIYAFTSNNTIQASTDGGTTWSVAATGLPPGISYVPSELVVDPSDNTRAFLVAAVNQAAFVAKLNSGGSALTWSTYLGGAVFTYAYSVASDGAGNAFVTGSTTNGQGFPITSSALPAGPYGAFITKISDATAACSTLSVNPGNTVISEFGQTINFSVVAPSGCTWSASADQPWAPITSIKSGTGDGYVTVQVTTSASATQTAILTVGTQHVTITQPGSSCSYSPDMSSYPVSAGGGPVTVILTATAGCPWSVTNPSSGVVSITSGASGTGSGTIDLMVSPNVTTTQRIFNLGVGNYGFQIVQAGAQLAQSITFALLPNLNLGTAPPPLTATATSGLTVVFTPVNPNACTISGNIVTVLAVGTCTINANQAGNSTYTAATQVTVSFTVYAPIPPVAAFLDQRGAPALTFNGATNFPDAGGFLINPPAVAEVPAGGVYIFGLDAAGGVHMNSYSPTNSAWNGWQYSGGILDTTSGLTAAVDPAGVVWFTGRDIGNRFWLNSWNGTSFGGWILVADGIFSGDSIPQIAIPYDGNIYVIGKDIGGRIWSNSYNPTTQTFTGWVDRQAVMIGQPSVTAGQDGLVYVAVRSVPSNSPVYITQIPANNAATANTWLNGGGLIDSDPYITSQAGTVYLTALAGGGTVYLLTFAESSQTWGTWSFTNGALSDETIAAADGNVFIAGRDGSDRIYWYSLTGNSWFFAGGAGMSSTVLLGGK
jgi:hypothetical protein